jgi:hypothetical protein
MDPFDVGMRIIAMDPFDTGMRLQTIVPGQETVTLFLRQGATDSFTQYVIYGARRRPDTKAFPQTEMGGLPVVESQWDLYQPTLQESGVNFWQLPQYQDYLVDQYGVQWVISRGGAKSKRTFWQLHCIARNGES